MHATTQVFLQEIYTPKKIRKNLTKTSVTHYNQVLCELALLKHTHSTYEYAAYCISQGKGDP
jgi:hypothetical protein